MKDGSADVAERGNRTRGRPTLSNEELLDRALDLFLEQGFERTSLDSITAAAGMAKRTLYQRYEDKMALFKAALRRAIDDWILPIDVLKAAETANLEETLLGVGRVLVANIMRPAGIRLLRITNAESARFPEIGAYTYELGTQRTIDYLAELLRSRIDPASTSLDQWQEAAIAYMYLVVCGPPTMTAWGMTLDDETIDRHTRFGVHLFLNGLIEMTGREGYQPAADCLPLSDGSEDIRAENQRLKNLLVSQMLETSRLKERLAQLEADDGR